MPKTILLSTLAALLIVLAWLRLEVRAEAEASFLWLLALAVVPALATTWRRRAAAAAVALIGAGAYLSEVSLLKARPFDDRDFFGPVVSRLVRGALEFYDVTVPFNAGAHGRMHAVVLFAAFAFTLLFALAVAARRPVAAAGTLVVAVGWPVTLAPRADAVRVGTILLGAVLVLLALLRRRGVGLAPQALPIGAALILAAVAASGSPAVAKGAFLDWETWDPYSRPDRSVSVRFVWDANYNGIRFPPRPTTVLEIEAPSVSLYWRATTLDAFTSDRWIEVLRPVVPGDLSAEPLDDPLLPARARDPERWIEARVRVKALEDGHLVGASIPVRYESEGEEILYASGGVALMPGGVPRDHEYTVWSYAARPTPRELARAPARYPAALSRYLVVEAQTSTMVPRFGRARRDEAVQRVFASNVELQPYSLLYDQARRIAGASESPYAAAVAIENWLRVTGGFSYDERPPFFPSVPALVGFVTSSKQGYCQHFAGAMALMLRYLGIPARVAVGFTSGRYDDGTWTVTDRDAHAWVEVWFKGIGWLPFDPTPGRGFLSATYSSSSPFFDIVGATAALGALADAADIKLDREFGTREGALLGRDRLFGDAERPGEGVASGVRRDSPSLAVFLAILLAFAAALVGLAKVGRRRLRYLGRDPRRVAAACRRELADFLADQRLAAPASATVRELCALVSDELGISARAFGEAADEARFGPAATAPSAARRARRELRRLLGRIRGELSVWERMRGLISLRSLAAQ